MAKLWAKQIRAGKRTLDDVPPGLLDSVKLIMLTMRTQ